MASVNKAIVVGNLGKDPEVRFTQSGRAMARFSVATTESWLDRENGRQERTEWHNIVAWDKLADFSNDYLYKGQLVSVEGVLHSRSWTTKAGEPRKTTEILCTISSRQCGR